MKKSHVGVKFMLTDDKHKISALYKTELDKFLRTAGIFNDFENGKLKCIYCERVITRETLHALIPAGDHFEFCCNNVNCILQFSEDATHGTSS